MKRTHIKDTLQVTLALLITGGMASAMTPPVTNQVQTKPAAKVLKVETPSKAPTSPVAAPAEQKVAVWQDNPNHCTDAQYIAADAPFNCIDKPVAQAAVQQTAPVAAAGPSVVAGCGDNSYAQYIYQHESGCNLNAVNSLGCRGIGQACPGSKLPCGADYACQNAWFSAYADRTYGGWAGAYSFWIAHSWW